MTKAARKAAFVRADEIARETATRWRVYRRTSNGAKAHKPKLVDAPNEAAALRKVRGSYLARPVLPSRVWHDILYSQVGLVRP